MAGRGTGAARYWRRVRCFAVAMQLWPDYRVAIVAEADCSAAVEGGGPEPTADCYLEQQTGACLQGRLDWMARRVSFVLACSEDWLGTQDYVLAKSY